MAKTKSKNGEPKAEHTRGPNLKAGKRQLEIPGAERPVNKELEKLVAPFVSARYERQELQKEEIRLHAEVLSYMRDNKISSYVHRDGDVMYHLEVVASDERVKVKRYDEASE